MATGPSHIVEFLARADAERDAGRGAEAARLYAQAAVVARRDGDDDAWAGAVLGAASVQVFGTEPGNLPPLLYDVLVRTTDDALRSRLAAALTRCWVYAGEAGRAAHFSQEAVERARTSGDPNLLANALDAALAAHWGPDDLEMRQALAGELDDVAAHVVEPEARLQAHLWGLQVACEVLDVQGMHRQVRALERLGEESPKARFFAASRRLMLDLLRGRTDSSAHLLAVAGAAAEESFIPDAWMVLAALDGYSAVQSGDVERVTSVACAAEAFAVEEGVTAVCAEAAYWFAAAGDVERAGALVRTFDGGVLQNLPRDVNWLLTLQCVLEAALAVGDANIIELAVTLLLPYAGRSVVNGGAVMFHGTTDDTLSRALTVQGCSSEAEELRARALAAYERIGARWWWKRLKESSPTGSSAAVVDGALSLSGRRVRLHPSAGGLWLVGTEGAPMAGLRGLEYVRELVCRPWNWCPRSTWSVPGARSWRNPAWVRSSTGRRSPPTGSGSTIWTPRSARRRSGTTSHASRRPDSSGTRCSTRSAGPPASVAGRAPRDRARNGRGSRSGRRSRRRSGASEVSTSSLRCTCATASAQGSPVATNQSPAPCPTGCWDLTGRSQEPDPADTWSAVRRTGSAVPRASPGAQSGGCAS